MHKTQNRFFNSYMNPQSTLTVLPGLTQTEVRKPMRGILLPRPHPEPPRARHSDLFKSS